MNEIDQDFEAVSRLTDKLGAVADSLAKMEASALARRALVEALSQRAQWVRRATTNADRRSALAFYLLAMADQAREAGSGDEDLNPLLELAFLLIGLDAGREASLFDVKRGRGKPSMSVPEVLRRADAAAAVDLFVSSGMTVGDATFKVAREIHETPGTVTEWRKDARGGHKDHDPSTWRYRTVLDGASHDPAECRTLALEIMTALKPKKGG